MKIPKHDRSTDFPNPNIFDCICDSNKGNFHDSCCCDLGTKLSNYSQYKIIENVVIEPYNATLQEQDDTPEQDNIPANLSSPKPCTASPTINQKSKKKVCFSCFKDKKDEGTYRISKETVAEKLLLAKEIHLNNPNSAHHNLLNA